MVECCIACQGRHGLNIAKCAYCMNCCPDPSCAVKSHKQTQHPVCTVPDVATNPRKILKKSHDTSDFAEEKVLDERKQIAECIGVSVPLVCAPSKTRKSVTESDIPTIQSFNEMALADIYAAPCPVSDFVDG
eukprot:11558643-Karenia_brevis.AAC.1